MTTRVDITCIEDAACGVNRYMDLETGEMTTEPRPAVDRSVATTLPTKRKGRPAGAKTVERAPCVCLPPACPTCGSTRREPYKSHVSEFRFEGTAQGPDGTARRYNRVVWRPTKCLDCGQQLTVREYHFDPDPNCS